MIKCQKLILRSYLVVQFFFIEQSYDIQRLFWKPVSCLLEMCMLGKLHELSVIHTAKYVLVFHFAALTKTKRHKN